MKIAFDIHGTLDKDPEILLPMMKALMKTSTIYIISGPPLTEVLNHLAKLNCEFLKHYDKAFSVVDFIRTSGVEMEQHENGSWYCDEENWWKSKARMCSYYEIDILIDNDIKYKEWLQVNTKFILWE